jgi:hypothetical protein
LAKNFEKSVNIAASQNGQVITGASESFLSHFRMSGNGLVRIRILDAISVDARGVFVAFD